MSILRERSLQLLLPQDARAIRFDNREHGLSHCMKAVDFIVEQEDHVLFIEIKDPDDVSASPNKKKSFIQEISSGKKDDELVRKYRDSFLYRWAQRRCEKPISYFVLIASSQLDEAMLLARTEALKRRLPIEGPRTTRIWHRKIVTSCCVFNLETWNRHVPRIRIMRITD